MLETLNEPDIRHVAVETPEAELKDWFELQPLTAEDLSEIRTTIKRERRKYGDAVSMINDANELGIPEAITETEINNLKNYVNKVRTENDQYFLAMKAYELERTGIDSNITAEDIDNMIAHLNMLIEEEGLLDNRTELARNIKVLGGNPFLPESDIQKITSGLEEMKEGSRWKDFATMARKMLETGLVVKISLEDVREMTEYLKKTLEELRHISFSTWDWGRFLRLAADMKYLSDHPIDSKLDLGSNKTQPPVARNF